MDFPVVVGRDKWVAARKDLLAKEAENARQREELAAERRNLPMVRVEKRYEFTGPRGRVELPDLFEGRRQLIVYHAMFDPSWDDGCKHCSFFIDNIPHLAHLHALDTAMVVVSRAPLDTLERYKARMGWSVPWYSSFGSDFNYDFHVTLDESVAPVEYDFQTRAQQLAAGRPWFTEGEQPGLSVFLRDDDGAVYHTYSAYAQGTDPLLGTYQLLDMTPLGSPADPAKPWLRHHDRY